MRNRRQEGAVHDVYAGEGYLYRIRCAGLQKGDLVKGNMTTDSNGAVILKTCILELTLCVKHRHQRIL